MFGRPAIHLYIMHALYFEIYTQPLEGIQMMSITGYEAFVCVCFLYTVSGKLSREKTFAFRYKTRISRITPVQLLRRCGPRAWATHPHIYTQRAHCGLQNFLEKTFTDGSEITKVFRYVVYKTLCAAFIWLQWMPVVAHTCLY